MIDEAGSGVIVLIRDLNPTGVSEKLTGMERNSTREPPRLREYGVGAQILLDLGVRDMVLLTNTVGRTIVGLEGYGLRVIDQRPIPESF